jgi:hypothetical protein
MKHIPTFEAFLNEATVKYMDWRTPINVDSTEVIGNPIKIGNLEVAEYDFPGRTNWKEAKRICADLGDGWRLPTKKELITMYKNSEKLGGFKEHLKHPGVIEENHYWSSDEAPADSRGWECAFLVNMNNGRPNGNFYASGDCRVRAVR